MNAVETFEHKGLTVKIYQDEDAESPDRWGNDGVFLITTRNRYFDVKRDGFTMDGCRDGEYKDEYECYPLIAYIHSGVALSLSRSYPFDCQWDSGQIGYVLVKRDECPDPYKTAESLVEEWNQFLSGDVYVVEIEDDGESMDCCGGMYGIEYARQEAKEMAEQQAAVKAKVDQMEREHYAV